MISHILVGWRESTLKQRSMIIMEVLGVLLVVIGITVWITALSISNHNNTIENSLIRQIGASNILSVRCSSLPEKLNVSVDFKFLPDQNQINQYLYTQVCATLRDEAITKSQYRNVQEIIITCKQNNIQKAILKGLRKSKDNAGKVILGNGFNAFTVEENGSNSTSSIGFMDSTKKQ